MGISIVGAAFGGALCPLAFLPYPSGFRAGDMATGALAGALISSISAAPVVLLLGAMIRERLPMANLVGAAAVSFVLSMLFHGWLLVWAITYLVESLRA